MWKYIVPLLWKSWCIRKRHYICTLLELCFPICFYVLLMYTKSVSTSSDSANSMTANIENSTYNPKSKDDILRIPLNNNRKHFQLAYWPNDSDTTSTMNQVKSLLNLYRYTVDLMPAANETEIEHIFHEKYINKSITIDQLNYGIIFHANSYTIRPVSDSIQTDSLFPAFALPGPGSSYVAYLTEGFVPLQITVNDVLFNRSGTINQSGSKLTQFNMTEFPYPSYESDESFKKLFTTIIPMLTIFGYYIVVPNLITNVILEKNSGSREWMSMVGIPKIIILIGWVLHSALLYIFTTLVCSIMLQVPVKGSPILTSTNFLVVWVLLLLFCTSTVLFIMAFTSFINNTNVAVIFGSMLWILPSVTVSSYQNAKNLIFAVKLLTCLFPSVSLNWAFLAISSHEANHEKITFANLFKLRNGQYYDISLGLALVFLAGTIVIYGTLFLYIDSVRPGPFGRAKPWYFPFKPLLRSFLTVQPEVNVPEPKSRPNFEDVEHLSVGLSFQGINKKFGLVTAVEDVTIDIYKGQITALLGHNGAGKTTLINIITGMFSPTKGKIWKDGNNVFDDFKQFQTHLGLCPQHDLLFPYLNVFEHVMFFGMLRGLSAKKAAEDSKELLKFFDILIKSNNLIKQLSGGMKRKLSLAVSLIGNPEILILDEPTSGMDPESRRETWNKLLALRGDRTIILTTHYMEEADVLGDMIAIMDHGLIKCYGTSLFLKKQYGSGYKVTVPACQDQEKVNQVVKSFLPEHSVPTQAPTASSLTYSFPLEKSSVFGNLFGELETFFHDNSKMHIACTTMDDVFLKVAQNGQDEIDAVLGDEEALLNDSFKSDDAHCSNEALNPKAVAGFALFQRRLVALFMKKLLFSYHCWSSTLFLTILYPFMILLVPLLLSSSILKGEFSDPSMPMDLNIYGDTEVLYSSSNVEKPVTDSFINLVKQQGSTVHLLQNNTSVNDALLDVGTENLSKYRFSYIIAANFTSTIANLYYSSIGTHSPPIAVNIFYNALYPTNASKYTTYNHPINFQNEICSQGAMMTFAAVPPMIWLFTFPTALAVICYSFSRLHHDERISSGKLLQLMTGTSPLLYWFSSFLCDVVYFGLVSLLIILYNYILDTSGLFSSLSSYGVFLLVMLLSFLSSTWFGYLMSFFLRTFSRLFSVNILLTFIFGEVAYFVFFILKTIDPNEDTKIADVFMHILFLFPSFCTSSLIFKVIMHYSILAILKKCSISSLGLSTIGQELFTWNDTGINKELVFLACDWIIYAVLIFLTDYGILGTVGNYIFNLYAGELDLSNSISDADVDQEKAKVEEALNLGEAQSNVIAHGLGKKYSRKLTAVKDVSFLVSKGECFGLLGVNGAGKSTTFKMLTGDLLPTRGFSVIFGDSLKENKLKYQSHIGYCPQSDAIIPALTGFEILSLYANLRGVNPSILNQTISYWISQFGLQSVANRACHTYSGGNKRKLSTAVSLIGDPQVILLDEPTTGVDPVARRKFWAVLSKLQKKGSAIILTSHSMDECETICGRLTIMVQGEMKCIGNIQRLKEIYGQGFTVLIDLEKHSDSQLKTLKSELTGTFSPHIILRDEHIGLLHYHINCQDYKWSRLFALMENIKQNNLIVKGYIISETTLEQIFLYFARM